MKKNVLGYVAIFIVALLISVISTSKKIDHERQLEQRKMLSIIKANK